MDTCSTGVCLPLASLMENKPLLIGIAVAILALIVGGYLWWRSRESNEVSEPQVEEFVGRQGATREEFEAAAALASQHEQQQQQQTGEQQQQTEEQHEE